MSQILLGIMQGRLLPPVDNNIQAFPFANWQEEFAIAKDLGFDCIEFIFDEKEIAHHPLMTKGGLNKIRNSVAKSGVRVYSICADYFMNNKLSGGNNVHANIDVLRQLIANASCLGVHTIVIPCVDQSRLRDAAECSIFVKSMKKCVPMAEKYHIDLALETDIPPGEFHALLQKFGSENVKINYDIGNSAGIGYEPREEFDTYGRWVTEIHIKDRLLHGGTVPLGQGNANFSKVFAILREIKYAQLLILQAARQQTGKERNAVQGYQKFLKPYMLGLMLEPAS